MPREPLVVLIEKSEASLYRLKADPKDKKFTATLVSNAELKTKLYDLGTVHSACISEEYGSVLLVNEDSFFSFKLREKELTADDLKDMDEE